MPDLSVEERRVFNMINRRGKVSRTELGEIFSGLTAGGVMLTPALAKLFELGLLEKTGGLDAPATDFYLTSDGLMEARKVERA